MTTLLPRGSAWLRGTLMLLTLTVIALTAARCAWRYDDPAVAKFDSTRQGHFDFHNGVYFPSLAFVNGVSPYGAKFAAEYPVTRPLPLLSPFTLMLHAPLVWLPIEVAQWLYFAINVLLLTGISWFCVGWIEDPVRRRDWFWVAMLTVMASRAGHSTLFTGYSTAELVLGTLVAVWTARQRPWMSAFGVAISSCKPTYAIPLFLLMVARGDHKAAWRGLALSVVLAAIPALWLLQSASPQSLLEDLQLSQTSHMQDAYEMPINSWTRIDIMAAVAKWMEWTPGELAHLAIMVILLLPAAYALWRLQRLEAIRLQSEFQGAGLAKRIESTRNLSCALITTSVVCTIYHHVYDGVLLIPAAFALLLVAPGTQRGSYRIRFIIGSLLLFVPWNYLSSDQVIRQLSLDLFRHKMLTSTGAIALFAAWVGLVALTLLPPKPK